MIYFLILVLLYFLILLYFKLANYYNIVDYPNFRSSHSEGTLRGGGIIFFLGILLYTVIWGCEYFWFTLGLTLICVISFIDDIFAISSKVRLIFQSLALFFMFYQWQLFTEYSYLYNLIAFIFCMWVINAYNFMDGINGITGGYSLVVLLSLAYINYEVLFIDPDFLYVCILSVLVFNFFNFRKKAKCFAGDIGAISIAFVILFALGKLILKTDNFSYLIILVIYGVDSTLTIARRLILHENIFEAHRKHLYQLMANELKIPHMIVASGYIIAQTIITIGYLLLSNCNIEYLITVLVMLILFYIWFIKKYPFIHIKVG